MAGEAAATLPAIQLMQVLFASFQSGTDWNGYLCPSDTSISDLTSIGSFDYIVVGAGSAGSVLARRLSECSNSTVLVLERGGCPPLESTSAGLFTIEPLSYLDYNMSSVDDGYSCQSLQDNSVSLTAGKMYGGSSSLHHMLYVQGACYDYNKWAEITGNSTFNCSNMLPYIKKCENVVDPYIMEEYGSYHSTSGPMILSRQTSSDNDDIIAAYAELGYTSVNDTNVELNNFVYVSPLLEIGDKLRQSGLVSYIAPSKSRSNLYFLSEATVSKVILDDNKVATGVQLSYGGKSYTLNANKEVILSAGALITPQLLMLSGIGNSTALSDLGITAAVDNEYVGKNLHDHPAACVLYTLKNDTEGAGSSDYSKFPVPMTCAYGSTNTTQEYPDYQLINLLFPSNSSGFLQLCMNTFKYNSTVCQAWYDANINTQVLFSIASKSHAVSTGQVTLNTTSIDDQPIVTLGLISNSTDLTDLASYLKSTYAIVNTTYFKSVDSKFVDLGICTDYSYDDDAYWECYALTLSSTMWHYSGTCSLGSCLDTSFNVVGTTNLRVVDASAMPSLPIANINAPVVALAERAAATIKAENSCSDS